MRKPAGLLQASFGLQKRDSMFLRCLYGAFRPKGSLHLPDMGFPQEEHADPGLADAAADGEGQFFRKDGFLERKFCPFRASGFL